MVHGVIRENGRGVPQCILQSKQKKKEDIEKVKGTVKAAVLKQDEGCGDRMVITSFYDSKPVYFCTNACERIAWVEKKRKVYSHQQKKMVMITYLRPTFVDEYNHGMNHVDLADQLRVVYRFDRWMRKRKWWWSMFFWGLELQMINCYVLYRKFYEMHDKKVPMDHYDFHKSIALAWICPSKYWVKENKKRIRRKEGAIITTNSSSRVSVSTITDEPRITRQRFSKEVAAKKGQYRRINDSLLDPSLELNMMRLNVHMSHMPTKVESRASRCQFHNWATGEQIKKQCCICMSCNVALCMECYAPYHLEDDLTPRRNRWKTEFNKSKPNNSKK